MNLKDEVLGDGRMQFEALAAASQQPQMQLLAVYELPLVLTDGFCHGGGRPIIFRNVDWFQAPPSLLNADDLTRFIKVKSYYDPTRRYLIIGRDDAIAFIMGATEK